MAQITIDSHVVELLVQAIDKMKIIDKQASDVQEVWVEFIDEIQVAARAALDNFKTEQTLQGIGSSTPHSHKTFI